MFLMTTMTATQNRSNQWLVSLYAGLLSAVVALLMALTTGIAVVPVILGLLIGAAPVLAYQFAEGALGSSWKAVIGGILGNILFVAGLFVPAAAFGPVAPILGVLSAIIWPIAVGALSERHSVGRLLLASLLGIVLAIVVALILLSFIGQDPAQWPEPTAAFFWAVWGGTVGAALSAWAR